MKECRDQKRENGEASGVPVRPRASKRVWVRGEGLPGRNKGVRNRGDVLLQRTGEGSESAQGSKHSPKTLGIFLPVKRKQSFTRGEEQKKQGGCHPAHLLRREKGEVTKSLRQGGGEVI